MWGHFTMGYAEHFRFWTSMASILFFAIIVGMWPVFDELLQS